MWLQYSGCHREVARGLPFIMIGIEDNQRQRRLLGLLLLFMCFCTVISKVVEMFVETAVCVKGGSWLILEQSEWGTSAALRFQ